MKIKYRPTFKAFKEKALQKEAVYNEYDQLQPIYELKSQMIKARVATNLTQSDVAKLLQTKKAISQDWKALAQNIFQILQL